MAHQEQRAERCVWKISSLFVSERRGPGSASAIRNCSLFSEGLLSDQQPITLGHACARQPRTTRCGHKVSVISFECMSSRTSQTLLGNLHTHIAENKQVCTMRFAINLRYPGFIWCKRAITQETLLRKIDFFEQFPVCACEIPTFTLAMSPSILRLTPPHNKTAKSVKLNFDLRDCCFFKRVNPPKSTHYRTEPKQPGASHTFSIITK